MVLTSKLWYFSPFYTCSVNQPIPQETLFWLKFVHNENTDFYANLISADISWKVLKNYSNKNDTKHDFNYERTLVEVGKIALIYFIEHLWNED